MQAFQLMAGLGFVPAILGPLHVLASILCRTILLAIPPSTRRHGAFGFSVLLLTCLARRSRSIYLAHDPFVSQAGRLRRWGCTLYCPVEECQPKLRHVSEQGFLLSTFPPLHASCMGLDSTSY